MFTTETIIKYQLVSNPLN